MARMPTNKELDLYDYIDVLTGKEQVETNDSDIVGRHLEEVLADKLDATLDKFEEPDLPELGVNIKSGGLKAAQNTIGSISYKKFKNMNDMLSVGATYCVFNCPFCMATLGQEVAEQGLMPILVSDLVQIALGD